MKTYFISYPCCGRTWLLEICKHLGNHLDTFKVSDDKIPPPFSHYDVEFTHDMFDYIQDVAHWTDVNRYFKDPYFSKLRRNMYLSAKLAFIVRDPRDVLVSYYYQKKYREPYLGAKQCFYDKPPKIDYDIDRFVLGDRYGIRTLVAFWNGVARHYQIDAIIRYEEMKKATLAVVNEAFNKLGIDVPLYYLEEAVKANEFDQLKARERIERFKLHNEFPPEPTMKVRQGKVGGHRDELKPETIKQIDRYLSKNLDPVYNYG